MQSGNSCFKSESIDSSINQSFMQFMICNLCDRLGEEHQRFMFTLVHKKNFTVQENLDKFKTELLRFNQLSSILAHQDFEHCKYHSVRALREMQRNTRRLCEVVDHKIERALDQQWQKNGASLAAA
jgi:hypothetical protein